MISIAIEGSSATRLIRLSRSTRAAATSRGHFYDRGAGPANRSGPGTDERVSLTNTHRGGRWRETPLGAQRAAARSAAAPRAVRNRGAPPPREFAHADSGSAPNNPAPAGYSRPPVGFPERSAWLEREAERSARS